MEFGIFNDEGQCERDFATKAEAERAIAERYDPGDEVHAAEVCHDHPEHERHSCEICQEDET